MADRSVAYTLFEEERETDRGISRRKGLKIAWFKGLARNCPSKIACKNCLTAPVDLLRIIRPGSSSPVTKVARLEQEVVQQRIAVTELLRDAFGGHQRVDLLVEQCA